MNEWRMIQLPRIVYATEKDFANEKTPSKDLLKRIDIFTNDFYSIGNKLLR